MRKISPKDFLDTVALGLQCDIFSFNEHGILAKSIGFPLKNSDLPHGLVIKSRRELLKNIHLTIKEDFCELPDKSLKLNKVFVPVHATEAKQGLLWVFCEEDPQAETAILSEERLNMIQYLSDAYGMLLSVRELREQNELYRQTVYHIANMLSNGLMLYDDSDNMIFYNRAAQQMDIVDDPHKKLLDVYTREFHTGKKMIGKIKYTSTQNGLSESYNEKLNSVHNIIGKDPRTDKILSVIHQVAAADTTVLLRGESGTGKEEYAKLIHKLSPRQNEHFVALNCAAIPESLLESELFGYEGGSFTGANKEGKMGKFQSANKGTLFLDEIGDMPLSLQVKLLRVLQERYVEPVGSNKKIPIDVRIVCATHQELESRIEEGTFREDLFYRINVIPITLPSLRHRKEDIELLVTYYVKKYCILQKKGFMTFSYPCMKALKNYDWPGNIRELINVVEYCVTMSNKSIIDFQDLPVSIQTVPEQQTATAVSGPIPRAAQSAVKKSGKPSQEELALLLKEFGPSTEDKKRLAKHLNISLATLYRWIANMHQGGL